MPRIRPWTLIDTIYNPSSFITLSLLDGENQKLGFREPLQNRVINSDKTLTASMFGG
jgi:hypothetical protein